MELYQLRYFVEAAHEANFTRAAKLLNIAQPALSQQIGNLEKELGARLFIRGRRETRLTAAGESLLPRAQALLADAEAARAAVADVAELRAGRLIVAAIPALGGGWLPRHVREFRQRYPQVEFRLKEGRSDEVAEMVERGHADLGFLQLPVDAARCDVRELFSERFQLAVSADHPLARQRTVKLARLKDEAFVVYKGRAREAAFDACRKAGFEPSVACESEALDTIRELVAAGLGVALLPALALSRPTAGLTALELSGPRVTRTLGWIHRRGLAPATAAKAFVGFFDSGKEPA